jgi:hypothetical protein
MTSRERQVDISLKAIVLIVYALLLSGGLMYGVWRMLRWLDTEDHGQDHGIGLGQDPGPEQGGSAHRDKNDRRE